MTIPSGPSSSLLVQVGTADLLLSDSERLAEAAVGAGVVSSWRWAKDYPTSTNWRSAPEAAYATERVGKFLRVRVPWPQARVEVVSGFSRRPAGPSGHGAPRAAA
jgi:hypothetical protein